MTSRLAPYLNFRGDARKAMEFYRSVLGGELTLTTFAEYPMMPIPDDEKDLVMHSQLETPDGYLVMGSDVPSHMDFTAGTNDHSVSLFGDAASADALRVHFAGLAAGGTIGVPLETAPWGDSFGMLTDRFGVSWMVNISGA